MLLLAACTSPASPATPTPTAGQVGRASPTPTPPRPNTATATAGQVGLASPTPTPPRPNAATATPDHVGASTPTPTAAQIELATSTPVPREAVGDIVGTIRDNAARPIGDATVQLRGDPEFMAKSGGDGRFRLQDVPSGEHVLLAWTAELVAASQDITVIQDATIEVDLVLITAVPTPVASARGTIAGIVRDTLNAAVPNASVRLRHLPQVMTEADADGRYVLAEVPVGDHTVLGWTSEFTTGSREVNVAAGATATADIVLVTALPVLRGTPQGRPERRPVPPMVLTQVVPLERIPPWVIATVRPVPKLQPPPRPAPDEPTPAPAPKPAPKLAPLERTPAPALEPAPRLAPVERTPAPRAP